MPPLEALKILGSTLMTKGRSFNNKRLKLARWDISRSHLMPEARRRLFVELPPEDQIPGQDDIGLLLRGMYGTQDAGQLWQEDYSLLLQSGGHKPGRASPATFYNADSGARTFVHGDDFVMLANDMLLRLWTNFFAASTV